MQEVTENRIFKWNGRTALLLALLAALLVFLPCLKADFLISWDDDAYILDNPLVRNFSMDHVRQIFTSLHRGLYKPLTLFVFSAEYALAGPNPAFFHAFNILLHLINCALVFRVTAALAGGVAVPFITALFFGIHPMHVESVAWITECKDLLYTLFFLAAWLGYLRHRAGGSRTAYALSLLWFALSLLSKPMGIMLPCVLILTDYLQERKFDYSVLKDKLPYLALAGVFLLGALFSIGSSGAMFDRTGYTALDDIAMAFCGLALYTARVFFPFNLSPVYPYPAKFSAMLPPACYLAPLVCLLLFGALLLRWRKDRALLFGLLFYLLTIAPGLQWLQLTPSIAFDHYSYIAYIGIFYIAGVFAVRFMDNRNTPAARGTVIAACLLAALAYGTAAHVRCKAWRTPLILWNDMLAKYPNDPTALANKSIVHFKRGNYGAALANITASLKAAPGNSANLKMRAAYYSELGMEDKAREDLSEALRLAPHMPELFLARGLSFARENSYDEAMADFRNALALAPDNAPAHLNMGWALTRTGRQEEGLTELNRALALNRTLPDALLNRASIYMMRHKPKEAARDLETALREEGQPTKAYALLGAAYLETGRSREAAQAFSGALRSDPANPDYLHGRGMALMASGDLTAAEADFSRALAARPNEAKFYGARGTCALLARRYSEAARDLSNSLALAPDNAPVLNNRASAYEGLAQQDKALTDYNAALKADPSFSKARLNKALLLFRTGRARQACAETVELPENSVWSKEAEKQFPGACKR